MIDREGEVSACSVITPAGWRNPQVDAHARTLPFLGSPRVTAADSE